MFVVGPFTVTLPLNVMFPESKFLTDVRPSLLKNSIPAIVFALILFHDTAPPTVTSPLIFKLSSTVTSSLASTPLITGVKTNGDVISDDTLILLPPKTPVKFGEYRFALEFSALSTSALVYVLLPFIVTDVPSEVSERLPADFKHLIVVPLK